MNKKQSLGRPLGIRGVALWLVAALGAVAIGSALSSGSMILGVSGGAFIAIAIGAMVAVRRN